MVQAFVFVHFHPRKYLFADKPGLDFDLRSSIYEPRQIDSNRIPFITGRINNKVIRQIFIFAKVHIFKTFPLFRILIFFRQMIVFILQKLRLSICGVKARSSAFLLCVSRCFFFISFFIFEIFIISLFFVLISAKESLIALRPKRCAEFLH